MVENSVQLRLCSLSVRRRLRPHMSSVGCRMKTLTYSALDACYVTVGWCPNSFVPARRKSALYRPAGVPACRCPLSEKRGWPCSTLLVSSEFVAWIRQEGEITSRVWRALWPRISGEAPSTRPGLSVSPTFVFSYLVGRLFRFGSREKCSFDTEPPLHTITV